MEKKTYRVVITDSQAIDKIESMIKHYIQQGKGLTEALIEAAEDFEKKNRSKIELVTENELVDLCQKEGLTTGKSSVVKYRRMGVLKDQKGPWVYQNAQNRVVYDKDKMMKFLRSRHAAPKSRINDTASGRTITGSTASKQ